MPTPYNQRGAFFGLDARIALIIFAILTAITGMVIYQRSGEIQDVRLYANLQEIERALKMMQRDLAILPGHALTTGITGDGADQFSLLCSNSLVLAGLQKNWKGPYIRERSTCNADIYKTTSITYEIRYATNTNVTSLTPPGDPLNACTATSSCYAWLGIIAIPAATFTYINTIVDEGNGASVEASPEDNGRVVFYNNADIWYRTEVHK